MFKLYIRKAGISEFYLDKVVKSPDSEMREATIRILSLDDTLALENFLQRRPYWKDDVAHYLTAEILNYGNGHRRAKKNLKNRERSRSPLRGDPSDINVSKVQPCSLA